MTMNSELGFEWDFQRILTELTALVSQGLLTLIDALKNPSVIAIGHVTYLHLNNSKKSKCDQNPNFQHRRTSFSFGQSKEKVG